MVRITGRPNMTSAFTTDVKQEIEQTNYFTYIDAQVDNFVLKLGFLMTTI